MLKRLWIALSFLWTVLLLIAVFTDDYPATQRLADGAFLTMLLGPWVVGIIVIAIWRFMLGKPIVNIVRRY